MQANPRLALVVEDSPEFQAVITQAMAGIGEGWRCHVADSGTQAMTALADKALRPDLVLVDVGLPDMSGITVIRAARAKYPKVPIMVVSVLSNSDNVLAAIRAGARGYLHKADSVLSLSDAIQRVLAGEHPISSSLAHYLFNLVQAQSPGSDESGLSPREVQLLRLLSQGYTYDEAAERMGVSLSTVQTFSRRIYQKLQVNSKVKALVAARERGIL